MIRRFTDSDRVPIGDALSVRIGSFFHAYSIQYDFAQFWVQERGKQAAAVLFLMDGCLTLVCRTVPDEELIGFVSAVGAHTVISNVRLSFDGEQRASVWEKECRPVRISAPSVDLRKLYASLADCFAMPPFDAWYVDLSHRVRHNSAVVYLDDCAAACAAVADGYALLTGVGVDADSRRQGKGSHAVRQIAALSGCKKMYSMSDQRENDAFYISLGFSPAGQVYQYLLEV